MRLVAWIQGSRKQDWSLGDGANFLIGRWDPDSGAFPQIDLESLDHNSKVSRKHAMIEVISGKIYLTDLGSKNGTYVNRGSRLEEGQRVEIKEGDEVIIGKIFLKLENAQ